MTSQPATVFEIDLDYCDLTFGEGACTASLSGSVVRKCFNTWNTCKLKSAFVKGVKTYRFITANSGIPKGGNYIPALVSASGRSGTVNIAGSDERLSALGERAVIKAKLTEFAGGDFLADKYFEGRIDGTAQTDEPGYNPNDRLAFFAKLKARNPNYAGRPCRIIQGVLENGVFTAQETRHFVLSSFDGPDSSGYVEFEAKDVLSLADNKKAVAPRLSRGFLSAEILEADTEVTILPEGIGSEYASSGFAVIGSEIVSFNRSGDVLTLTGRGLKGTAASRHNTNDTVQQTYSVSLKRIDAAIYELLTEYAGINADWIPYSEWQAECERWAPNLVLSADICKPEGVSTLIGELAILGVSIWWDDVNQKIRLKINRPPDLDTVVDFTDAKNAVSVMQEDREDDRLTRVSFATVQINPTKALNKDNFLRTRVIIDVDAESENNYNGQRSKEIYCRWLNQGGDSLVRILGKRLLNRFNKQPVLYEIVLDQKDNVELSQVIQLTSRVVADDAGKAYAQLAQVRSRNDVKSGSSLKIEAQKFQYDKRYGYVTENDRPVYSLSSEAQKARGAYIVDDLTLVFGDNTGPYVFS